MSNFSGDRLRSARIMNGFSLRELAKAVNLSHESIHRFEKGKLKPDSETIYQLSKVLKVRIDYFSERPIKIEFGKIRFFKSHIY